MKILLMMMTLTMMFFDKNVDAGDRCMMPITEVGTVIEKEIVEEPEYIYYSNCKITFYCQCEQCCGQWAWSNTTASGATPYAGWTVANGGLPFGTRVMIDGHEYCVEDRGVGSETFDIYVNSHSDIPSIGTYYTDVYIIND